MDAKWASWVPKVLVLVFAIFVFTSSFVSDRVSTTYHKPVARRKLDDIAGSISIDCGIPEGFSYEGYIREVHYISDEKFIDSGINLNISLNYTSQSLQKSLMNVRSFPQGNRNCYTLKPPEGNNTVYLIRASFMYGNYDGRDQLPEFDLYLGVTLWDSVKFDNASHVVMKEIIHFPLQNTMYICLLNTGSGTPFISALEIRHLHNASYRTQSGSLMLYKRLDVGSTSNQIGRYKDDDFDRIWFPYNIPNCVSFNTSSTIDSTNANEYELPSTVMRTAIKPLNFCDSLDFEFDNDDPLLKFYVYMHFAELERLQGNQIREFNIDINGILWNESIVPKFIHSTTISSKRPVEGSKLSFSIYKTSNSTLPPILNAMEIYREKDFLQAATDQEDVKAISDIKSSYEVGKLWQGDPCLPVYPWNGLNCSYNGYDPPRIISLDLSSSGLKGKILPSLSSIRLLENLNLAYNSLTGELPDFLAQLPSLKTLNLTGNRLSGSIPPGLLERSNNRSLLLSVSGNPDLCLSTPCKEEKNNEFVLPLIVAIVATSVVIIIALFTLWRFKRKKQVDVVARSFSRGGSLKSNNQHFTYSEVVIMTENFQRVIGKGGSGTVYHGYLSNGTQVAVKMLSPLSTQASTQFQTEAQFLTRIHHRNLVSFVGYCNEGTNYGLIYEYMANGSLQGLLSNKTKYVLSWKERLQIAVDVAQGLEYMHNGCKPHIIHRDVKPANILLDENLLAKLADFGISKFFHSESQSHLSTAVVGTPGYLDPAYYTIYRLTEKSDVYSFGIVLLQLITGQPAIIRSHENTHIVQWVTPILARGDIRSIIDSRLQENFDTNSVWKVMETAMACIPSISSQRPTMTRVLMELKECLDMDIAYHQSLRMDGRLMKSSNSIDESSLNLELELGPEAR